MKAILKYVKKIKIQQKPPKSNYQKHKKTCKEVSNRNIRKFTSIEIKNIK